MEIKTVPLTKEILQEIEKIDDTFYENDITGIKWYTDRYKSNHEAVVLLDQGRIVGYIIAVPVKKDLFDALASGCILNDVNINPKMFVKTSEYYYLSSIVLLDPYRNKGYGRKMTNVLFKKYKDKSLVALVVSEVGYNLLNRYATRTSKLPQTKFVFQF